MMGLQLRELASWAQSRKLLTAVLVMLTLSIGILIGTLVSGLWCYRLPWKCRTLLAGS
jgi:hypothetical protein